MTRPGHPFMETGATLDESLKGRRVWVQLHEGRIDGDRLVVPITHAAAHDLRRSSGGYLRVVALSLVADELDATTRLFRDHGGRTFRPCGKIPFSLDHGLVELTQYEPASEAG